tara:strand:- start:5481 stop:5627 length:147 start_codon:yes stop_codon:yes gene_type:complete
MMQNYHYSLTEIDEMMPWEREIYVGMLQQHIEEENERIKRQNAQYNNK